MIRDAIRSRLPAVPPGGLTLAYVDDVADGHLAAFDRGKPGERYILADGYRDEPRDLRGRRRGGRPRAACRRRFPPASPAALAVGSEAISRVIRRPPLIGRGQLYFLLWEARADSSKARAELGIEPLGWRDGSPAHRALDAGRGPDLATSS